MATETCYMHESNVSYFRYENRTLRTRRFQLPKSTSKVIVHPQLLKMHNWPTDPNSFFSCVVLRIWGGVCVVIYLLFWDRDEKLNLFILLLLYLLPFVMNIGLLWNTVIIWNPKSFCSQLGNDGMWNAQTFWEISLIIIKAEVWCLVGKVEMIKIHDFRWCEIMYAVTDWLVIRQFMYNLKFALLHIRDVCI